MRTQGRSAVFSFLVVAALAASLAGCGDRGARRGGSVERAAEASPAVEPPVRTLPPLPARPLSPRLEAERTRAAVEAARLRGLAWLAPVGMTELSGWEYGTRTRELADVLGGDDLAALSRLAVAGGILPEGTDLAALASTFTAVAADATYSPLDKQVLLVSGSAKDVKDSARRHSLFTHEHVHALQDQHFDLLRMLLARPYNFDRTEAAFAVVEGDAVNVQRRLEEGDAAFARRPLSEIWRQEDARFATARRQVGAFFPPLLTETFFFRYRDGSRFVEAVRRARPGADAANELFRRPPASTEQVLHPEKYLAGEGPREAALDEPRFASEGWRAPASTPLGEMGVRGLLLAGVAAQEAERAAAGWGGDRAYVFEREGSPPLFAWRTLWDKPSDAAEFFRAYNSLLRRTTRAGTDESEAQRGVGESQAREVVWRDGALVIVVRLEADAVLILRGAEADVQSAARLARAG
ncbi:MAG TPA: hypothetical protein VFX96_17405 [Pyrinomonadaceae bacterium]|nr:hypothetical protein [Pyrinomonadaceae bacterium]